MDLEILFESENLIAINKPHGLLVHRTKIAAHATEFALQKVRDYTEKKVYPIHRIDRKTSGVLLFGLNKEYTSEIMRQFREHETKKIYIAIVRGYTEDQGTIDYPLVNDRNKLQEAQTLYKTLERCEIDKAFGRYKTCRYSVVELKPTTGRMHQLRKHMAHIFHPIIGDRPHGCNKQNKLWKEEWQFNTMLLHALKIKLFDPYIKKEFIIQASLSEEFRRGLKIIGSQLKI